MRPALLSLLLAAPAARADDGFTPLFNGKDFSGWSFTLRPNKENPTPDPKNTWQVTSEGVLHCVGKPNGYIATEKEYGDYVLRVKWRFPAGGKGGNSGVLLHCQPRNAVWPNSIEAQLAAGSAGDIWLIADESGKLPKLDIDQTRKDAKNKEGRHYFRLLKEEKIEKPFGEWNQYEITCKGGDVSLVVNGKAVNEGTNGELKKGRIALQSEGVPVEFKEIEIKVTR